MTTSRGLAMVPPRSKRPLSSVTPAATAAMRSWRRRGTADGKRASGGGVHRRKSGGSGDGGVVGREHFQFARQVRRDRPHAEDSGSLLGVAVVVGVRVDVVRIHVALAIGDE